MRPSGTRTILAVSQAAAIGGVVQIGAYGIAAFCICMFIAFVMPTERP